MKKMLRMTGMILVIAMATVSLAWAGGTEEPAPAAGTGDELQAPMLAEMVANGELEPLEERLPDEPAVLTLLGEPGVYGGTLYSYAVSPDPWNDLMPAPEMSPRFLQMDMDGNISASLLSDWEISDDFTVGTFTLREGMKWSDGVPVTMDDVRIVYEVMNKTEGLTWWNLDYPRKGYTVDFEALDEWTFRLTLNKPKPRWEEELAGNAGNEIMNIQPAHWLGRWHPDFNENAQADAEEAGYEDWKSAFNDHYNPYGISEMKPTLHPWYVAEVSSDRRVLERNPYFYGVDPEGRQLPYADQIVTRIVDRETYNLQIVSGETDVAYIFPTFNDFTLFKQNEDAGNYTVTPIPSLYASNLSVLVNLTNPDPVKRDIAGDLKFRQAVSLAINRDEINDVLYSGQATVGQTTAKPTESWYEPEWAESYVEYDPDAASALLDELGLDEVNSNGFRLGPDGNVFTMILLTSDGIEGVGDPAIAAELIKEYLEDIGLRIEIRNVGNDLHNEALDAGTYDMTIEGAAYLQEYESFAVLGDENWGWAARDWFNWLQAERQIDSGEMSRSDFPDGLPGEEPPQWVKDHEDAFARARQVPPDSAEYARLMKQIFQDQADQLVIIGVAGQLPDLFISSNRVHNTPERYNARQIWQGELGEYAYQFYIQE